MYLNFAQYLSIVATASLLLTGCPDGSKGSDSDSSGMGGDDTSNDDTGGGDSGGTYSGLLFSTSSSISVESSSSMSLGSVGTIEFWTYWSGGSGRLYTKFTQDAEDKWVEVRSGGAVYAQLFCGTTGDYLRVDSGSANIASGAWSHVAIVWDESGSSLFIDGIRTTCGGSNCGNKCDPADSSSTTYIGHVSYENAGSAVVEDAATGFLAEYRISNILRYSEDFTPEATLESDAFTQGLWRMDEGTGDVIRDSSSNNADGVASGTTWADVSSR